MTVSRWDADTAVEQLYATHYRRLVRLAVLLVRDVEPQAPTHVLVVPRRHEPDAASLAAAAPTELVDLVEAASAVAEQEGLGEGYRMVFNTGPAAHQTVFHAHLHVLGGRSMGWPPG